MRQGKNSVSLYRHLAVCLLKEVCVMLNKILGKVKSFANKGKALVVTGLFVANEVAAQTASGLTLPSDTESKLVGYIQDAFPTVIGVVIAIVGVGVIIRMIKRAG
jgi:hypothetical protein